MKLVKKFFEKPVTKLSLLFLLALHSNRTLVIKIAVNNEVTIPINKVVANPLIGPVPKINNTAPVKIVVTLAYVGRLH